MLLLFVIYWSDIMQLTCCCLSFEQKTCDLGSKYLALEEETQKLRAELDEERTKSARLEYEKKALGGMPYPSNFDICLLLNSEYLERQMCVLKTLFCIRG